MATYLITCILEEFVSDVGHGRHPVAKENIGIAVGQGGVGNGHGEYFVLGFVA